MLSPRLIARKPLFFVRTVWQLIFRQFGKDKKINGIEFAPHYACNFKCAHCYEKKFRESKHKPMGIKEQSWILTEAIDAGVLSVTFVGGEAAIHPQLPELIKAAKPWKTYISIASNGWVMTEDKLVELQKLGVDKVNMSLDSWDPAEHDDQRQKAGSHRRVMEAVDICNRLGLAASLSMVVQRGSTQTEGFKKIVEYTLEKDIRLQFKLAVPMGEWEGRKDLLIDRRDRAVVDELMGKNPRMTSCFSRGCQAMRGTVTISAYGDVMPCNCNHVSMGNLREERFVDILDRGRQVSYFDASYRGCLVSENMDYIETILPRISGSEQYPAPYAEVFPELADKEGSK
ncbi:radical SAM protein [Pseudodesulfovibrio sp.]|nr:radical SAM protein [Pseudodesulfovibrio sp.]